MRLNASSFFTSYAFLTILNTLVFSLLYALFPHLRKGFVSEDQFIENASAFLCLASFLLGVVFLAARDAKAHRKVDAIVPVLGLVGFLDEISFGERVFHIRMPIVYGVKVDGFHDVFFSCTSC